MSGFVECDHPGCPAGAVVFVAKEELSLAWCGHHFAADHEPDLIVNGWHVVVDGRQALRHAEAGVL